MRGTRVVNMLDLFTWGGNSLDYSRLFKQGWPRCGRASCWLQSRARAEASGCLGVPGISVLPGDYIY